MKYYLNIDESGDHGLSSVNPDFPVFILCGVLVTAPGYAEIDNRMDVIKEGFWKGKQVIFHSRDIRKCEKEFSVLFDLDLKKLFYEQLNAVLSSGDYTVIASAIKKEEYIKKYGRLANDVYEVALSFIIERAVFFLDAERTSGKQLEVIIEKRGKQEDKKLHEHFQRLLARGTGYVNRERLAKYGIKINFKSKKENINGLQLADLVAYPLARYVIEPKRANPAFDIVESKIYTKDNAKYGLKIFP
jgi:hypothetical protein